MGLSGGVETKQKQYKTSVHHPRLRLLVLEALWQARAQAIPLGLTVARTSWGPRPGSMVRSRSWYKTLLALTVEAEHLNQTPLMR